MGLNEVGDFLAGAFGPVAILWLVLGFFQQGVELRQGTEALKLQAAELKNSVVQQCELVAAQKASLKNYESSLQPLLILDISRTGWGQEGFYVGLKIVNTGDYCESVVVKVFATDNDIRRADLDPILSGATCFATFGNLPEWEDFNVVVDYKTRSGVPSSQSFSVTHHYEEGYGDGYSAKKHPFLS